MPIKVTNYLFVNILFFHLKKTEQKDSLFSSYSTHQSQVIETGQIVSSLADWISPDLI